MPTNRYPGTCPTCRTTVEADKGVLAKVDGRWVTYHPDCAGAEQLPLGGPNETTAPPVGTAPVESAQPAALPVDGWAADPMVGFDLETTGTDVWNDRIVTASLCYSDGRVSSWLIDPGVEIPAAASQIHGITTERARAEGLSPAEALKALSAELTIAIADELPIVAFRASFDLTLAHSEFRRHSIPNPPWEDAIVIDPSVLDKQVDRFRRGRRTLTDVCRHYGVRLDDAHTSDADALAALELARQIGARFPKLAGLSPRELHSNQVSWNRAHCEDLERYYTSAGRPRRVVADWPMYVDHERPRSGWEA